MILKICFQYLKKYIKKIEIKRYIVVSFIIIMILSLKKDSWISSTMLSNCVNVPGGVLIPVWIQSVSGCVREGTTVPLVKQTPRYVFTPSDMKHMEVLDEIQTDMEAKEEEASEKLEEMVNEMIFDKIKEMENEMIFDKFKEMENENELDFLRSVLCPPNDSKDWISCEFFMMQDNDVNVGPTQLDP